MAIPHCSAAKASVRLKAAPEAVPPVIEEIRIGAARCLLKRVEVVLMRSKFNSGRVLGDKRTVSKPVETIDRTSSSRLILK